MRDKRPRRLFTLEQTISIRSFHMSCSSSIVPSTKTLTLFQCSCLEVEERKHRYCPISVLYRRVILLFYFGLKLVDFPSSTAINNLGLLAGHP